MEQITRTRGEGKALRLKRYFTGKPCPKGHIGDRFVSSMGCCECAKGHYSSYMERHRGYHPSWRAANPEKVAATRRRWIDTNPEKHRGASARYRATKLSATPAWANPFFIEEAYALAPLRAKATGVPHEVDHIVPLISKTVCGLHNEFNLQVIPKSENRAKQNRYWPDMPT